MQWALLGVIAVALILMSGRYPKTAFTTLALLIIGAGLIVMLTGDDARRDAIAAADVRIENPSMQPDYAGGWQLNARLANLNPHVQVRRVTLSVTMLDCIADECTRIGQSEEWINIKIPPGQARDVSQSRHFGNAAPRGETRWRFEITQVEN